MDYQPGDRVCLDPNHLKYETYKDFLREEEFTIHFTLNNEGIVHVKETPYPIYAKAFIPLYEEGDLIAINSNYDLANKPAIVINYDRSRQVVLAEFEEQVAHGQRRLPNGDLAGKPGHVIWIRIEHITRQGNPEPLYRQNNLDNRPTCDENYSNGLNFM